MQKKDVYVYPAVFNYADDGISISFPDLPGCFSCADTDEEALRMARDAMGLHLWAMEDDGDAIPAPTSLNRVELGKGDRPVLIEVYMPLIRAAEDNKAVKKTLTIPAWMDAAAKAHNINFSLLLQNAILSVLQHKQA